MERISIAGERGESLVVVGAGARAELPQLLAATDLPLHPPVVTDLNVAPLWARDLAARLESAPPLELEPGEEHKGWPQVERVCRWLLGQGIHRGDILLAVGGGVLSDTAGFAAAVYQRGIAWAAVTTTLLGMVDASVGGKTGVNLPEGKNLVGAFWAPRLVVADVEVLATLPGRELRAGLAEAIKTAWIGDRELLGLLPERVTGYGDLSPGRWTALVARCVRVKASVVSGDEREAGLRQVLNLGHTLGHALESVTGYERFLHGEAVAWGLVAAAGISRSRGLLGQEGHDRLVSAVARLGELPRVDDLEPRRVLEHLARDKKRGPEGIAWVLPTDGGVRRGERVSTEEVLAALRSLRGRRPGGR